MIPFFQIADYLGADLAVIEDFTLGDDKVGFL